MEQRIAVGGLAQLSRALKQLDNDAPKQLRVALNDGASLLVSAVAPKVPSRTGAARRSLVARSTRTAARVAAGGKRAPYYPWLDFGGQGRRPGRPAPRPFLADGRYFYPTLKLIRPKIEGRLQESISTLISGVGLQED